MKLLHLFQPTNPDKPLGGRYKVISQLGAGGFGQTFLAEDLHLPGNPQCVVKQLKPQVTDASSLQTARRLFDIEAKVLYQLGDHDQIPRLLAHFEDNSEFYLAQELIEGEPLTQEFAGGSPWSEAQAIALLQDLLHVLAFVHQQQVIHRDIKPSNLIRRRQDGRIVLIDFGAVKEASTQVVNPQSGDTKTISIGTQGYTPKEQLGGNPRFSSDIYAVGMIGIQALTGIHPRRLKEDPQTGEIDWHESAPKISAELRNIVDCMVRYDFRDRYPTALEALEAICHLSGSLSESGTMESDVTAQWTQTPTVEAPSSTTGTTGSSADLSATPIWHPTQPPIQPQSVVSNTHSSASGSQSLSSPNASASSAPTVTTPEPAKGWFLTVWSVLGIVLAGGAALAIAKVLFFTPPPVQTTVTSSVSVERPEVSPTSESTSPESPEAEPSSPSASEEKAPVTPKNSKPERSSVSPAKPLVSPPSVPNSGTGTKASPTPASSPANSTPVRTSPAPKPPPTAASSTPKPQPTPSPQLEQAQEEWNRCYNLNIQQKYAEAITACDRAIAINPNYPEALWSKGFALDQQKRHEEALTLYERATELKPDFAEAWSNQGTTLLLLNRPKEALTAFDKATALKPDLAAAWRDRGAALIDLGRNEEAIASLEKALQLQPNDEYTINLLMTVRLKRES